MRSILSYTSSWTLFSYAFYKLVVGGRTKRTLAVLLYNPYKLTYSIVVFFLNSGLAKKVWQAGEYRAGPIGTAGTAMAVPGFVRKKMADDINMFVYFTGVDSALLSPAVPPPEFTRSAGGVHVQCTRDFHQ